MVPTSHYVWLNQTATFECATNITGYTVTFLIPDAKAAITNDPLPGGGQKSNATIKAIQSANGTNVTCGTMDNSNRHFEVVETSDTVHLFAQGKNCSIIIK